MSESYACFLADTEDRPFVDVPYPHKDGVTTGFAVATTRLLLSYDYSLGRHVSLGGRIGYAFGGGPPAGQTPSDDGVGAGGTPFLPAHVEARFTLWLSPPSGPVSAFLGASGGLAQVDAKVTVNEKSCTRDAQLGMPPGTTAEDAFDACRIASSNFDFAALPDVKVDAWKKLGQGFYGLHAGVSVELADRLRGLANVNVMRMAPATGIVLEPSLGAMLGF